MKNLYESILGDIDTTLAKSDKNAELVSLNLPKFDDFKRAVNRRGGGAIALYIWKMPTKVLNKVQGIIYKITGKMTWLSPYEQNPTNIIVGCSPNKLYIKLAVDRTIVGIPVLNFSSGYRLSGISTKNFDECKELAYRILLAIADVTNLEELLTAHENGYYDQTKMIEKLLDKPKFFMEGILDDIDNQISANDDVINKFNIFTEMYVPYEIKFNTDYLSTFNRCFEWDRIKADAKGLKFRSKAIEDGYKKELARVTRICEPSEVKIFKKVKDLLLIVDNLKFDQNIMKKDSYTEFMSYLNYIKTYMLEYLKPNHRNPHASIYMVAYDNQPGRVYFQMNCSSYISTRGAFEFLFTIQCHPPKSFKN